MDLRRNCASLSTDATLFRWPLFAPQKGASARPRVADARRLVDPSLHDLWQRDSKDGQREGLGAPRMATALPDLHSGHPVGGPNVLLNGDPKANATSPTSFPAQLGPHLDQRGHLFGAPLQLRTPLLLCSAPPHHRGSQRAPLAGPALSPTATAGRVVTEGGALVLHGSSHMSWPCHEVCQPSCPGLQQNIWHYICQ